MNVANYELSRELLQLLGWGKIGTYSSRNPGFYWVHKEGCNELNYGNGNIPSDGDLYPAYDLGFLMRKLPRPNLYKEETPSKDWVCGSYVLSRLRREWADTPEDAAAKLAIALAKAGVLIKEDTTNAD